MIYTFHRQFDGKTMFYALALSDNAAAIENAKANEGTLSVKDEEGRLVWSKDQAQH